MDGILIIIIIIIIINKETLCFLWYLTLIYLQYFLWKCVVLVVFPSLLFVIN
jgi:hypothetical protein